MAPGRMSMLIPGLLSMLPASGQVPSTPPTVAPTWKVNFVMGPRPPMKSAVGSYFYDRVGQRYRQTFRIEFDFTAAGTFQPMYDVLYQNVTWMNHNVTVGEGADAVCRPAQHKYADLFDGLDRGAFGGRKMVRGEPCDVWSFNSTDGFISTSICLAADGVPREFNTTALPISAAQKAFDGVSAFSFTSPEVGELDDETFAVTTACATNYPTPLCPSTGIKTLDLYRIHSGKEPNEVENRNAGNALGDLSFMCEKDGATKFKDALVTHWQLETETTWGQYAYCLFTGTSNECGGLGRQIGRESSWGLGKGALQGQCSDNDDVGSWYAVPDSGKCKPGEPIGTNGCTWTAARPLRTVHASCMFNDRNLSEVCAGEREHQPYKRAVEVFVNALASSDPSRGGCPDATTSESIVLI